MNVCKNLCIAYPKTAKHNLKAIFCSRCDYHILTDDKRCKCCKAKYRKSRRWKNRRNRATKFCRINPQHKITPQPIDPQPKITISNKSRLTKLKKALENPRTSYSYV